MKLVPLASGLVLAACVGPALAADHRDWPMVTPEKKVNAPRASTAAPLQQAPRLPESKPAK